ncbi:F-box protein skip19 [Trifolium pratense]|uniref:F-box protein skip19 n=1 Tax=Trifolium pratense TaxID=57577 RepID=A0A2K3MIU6_TRIPR|nr:F-box protein skip19 [Trifolium pratense]
MASSEEETKGENTTMPNWLELPTDLTKNIFQRLDTVDIVISVRNVCRLWWNICKDPLMWRTIRMGNIQIIHMKLLFTFCCLEKIFRCAINKSCGHVEDIDVELIVTNDVLEYMAYRASHLRRLRLYCCDDISDRRLYEFVKKFSLLEELDISFSFKEYQDFIEVIGQCCPLLKSLNLERLMFLYFKSYDEVFAIAKWLPGLRHLKLSRIVVGNVGLLAILDGCPLLESLDIRQCHRIYLSESLEKRCHEQIKDFQLPTSLVDDDSYYADDYDGDDGLTYKNPTITYCGDEWKSKGSSTVKLRWLSLKSTKF